jgi:hypothetical protein
MIIFIQETYQKQISVQDYPYNHIQWNWSNPSFIVLTLEFTMRMYWHLNPRIIAENYNMNFKFRSLFVYFIDHLISQNFTVVNLFHFIFITFPMKLLTFYHQSTQISRSYQGNAMSNLIAIIKISLIIWVEYVWIKFSWKLIPELRRNQFLKHHKHWNHERKEKITLSLVKYTFLLNIIYILSLISIKSFNNLFN